MTFDGFRDLSGQPAFPVRGGSSGRECVANEEDGADLADHIEAVRQTRAIDCREVWIAASPISGRRTC
jgi:hypothetical protein